MCLTISPSRLHVFQGPATLNTLPRDTLHITLEARPQKILPTFTSPIHLSPNPSLLYSIFLVHASFSRQTDASISGRVGESAVEYSSDLPQAALNPTLRARCISACLGGMFILMYWTISFAQAVSMCRLEDRQQRSHHFPVTMGRCAYDFHLVKLGNEDSARR